MTAIAAIILALVHQGEVGLRANPIAVPGPGYYQTVVVEGKKSNGGWEDISQESTFELKNTSVAMVFQGRVYGLIPGETLLTVNKGDKKLVIPIRVGNAHVPNLDFEHDILPLLSRHHCNSSGCHGKAEGQNGFKLSVLGSDPEGDFEAVAFEARGRRIQGGSPGESLLVKKMSGQVAHGGGARIPTSHPDFQTVVQWIARGSGFSDSSRAAIKSIKVIPPLATLANGESKALTVLAAFDDGSEKEVTAHCKFTSNQESLAVVSQHGLVSMGNLPGEAVIVAAYLDKTTIFRVENPRTGDYSPVPAQGNWIDKPIYEKLARLRIPHSSKCSDEEFLRRAYLDLIGVVPTPIEAQKFLNNPSGNKRQELVDQLLQRPEYADLWALIWSDLLRVDRQVLGPKNAYSYYRWIHKSFAENKPMDAFGRELVTAKGSLSESPQASLFKVVNKPGELASTASQVFLGTRITCAECHHHPFDRWSQADYLGMQSFFTGLQWKGKGKGEELANGPLTPGSNPRYKKAIYAHALGEAMPAKQPEGEGRALFADWMTKPGNPFFARTLANRVWAHLLGRGLVDPVDDMRDTNPPSHPDLLQSLGDFLVKNSFDQKALIKAITASDVYQRSSAVIKGNESDEWNYSRFPLKPMLAEVLLDAISAATGVSEDFPSQPAGMRATQLWDSRESNYFLKVHGRPSRVTSCTCERVKDGNIAQVLHELNSPGLQRKLQHENGRVALLARNGETEVKAVEELYLAFFSRKPSAVESEAAMRFLQQQKEKPYRENLEDLAWTLMNSIEFLFIH